MAQEDTFDVECALLADGARSKTWNEDYQHSAEGPSAKRWQYEKARRTLLIANSNLQSLSVAMLFCLTLFFGLISARGALKQQFKWPVYIDFIPLFILSCLVYVAASDYAATRLSTHAVLGKVAITFTGLFGASSLLLLNILISLKLSGAIDWQWTRVMSPFWMCLLFVQLLFWLMLPGFLRNHMLKLFLGAYLGVWMLALAVLLTTLILDGELQLPHVHLSPLLPIWGILGVLVAGMFMLQVAMLWQAGWCCLGEKSDDSI